MYSGPQGRPGRPGAWGGRNQSVNARGALASMSWSLPMPKRWVGRLRSNLSMVNSDVLHLGR